MEKLSIQKKSNFIFLFLFLYLLNDEKKNYKTKVSFVRLASASSETYLLKR